jgi:hypothetical protein
MKIKYLLICLIILSCQDDGIKHDQPGCVTGIRINDASDKRVLIGCGTKEQSYNFALYHVDYIDVQWKSASTCEECK